MRSALLRWVAALALGCVLAGTAAAMTAAESEALAEADALVAGGELEAAAKRLSRAVEQHPDSARLHLRLGGIELLRQRHAEAVEVFQTAVALGEGAPAFIGLGIALLHIGQYGQARAALEEAVRLAPGKKPEVEPLLAWLERRSPEPVE